MNFLAHVLLSSHDNEEMVGNLLGDFVRKGEEIRFSETMQRGILLHRRIDGFTDRHPVFRRSRKRVRPELRRFGGIAVDLFYDHFLAREFSSYHDMPLEPFAQRLYRLLEHHEPRLPSRLRQIMPAMIGRDWLVSYREVDAVERALGRISQRLSRPNALAETAQDLRMHYENFASDFEEFFPQLLAFSKQQRVLLEKSTFALH
jgi:acyl carrier protein phosphodiesterase